MNSVSFLWHDYETFGIDPRTDRPAQFAAVRTDAELNEIGTPINILCQPAPDYLPSAQSCLITGITPQQCLQQGLPEHQFAEQLHAALAQPDTIGVGYNSIRFDDEFTRFLFWRNLIDPYGREWQNGCSRWDLLDVVRMFYALRPDGIVWPQVDGKPSFRLELLTAANGIAHEAAHDALSDVRATVALARLLRQHNPRLFDFALSLRKKDRVAEELGLPAAPQHARPFVHVSGMYPAERGCLAMLWPLASRPGNRNEILAWDLRHDPSELALLDATTIRQRLFTPAAELPPGMQRLPIRPIALNKSPMVLRWRHALVPQLEQRWQFDVEQHLRHAAMARDLPDMSAIWAEVYARPAATGPAPDVDGDLYGGFLGNGDRHKLDELRQLPGEALAHQRISFEDDRLHELLFRYRARNFPDSLNAEETLQWQEHCCARLLEGTGNARTVDALLEELDTLQTRQDLTARQQKLLDQLHAYAEDIVPQD